MPWLKRKPTFGERVLRAAPWWGLVALTLVTLALFVWFTMPTEAVLR